MDTVDMIGNNTSVIDIDDGHDKEKAIFSLIYPYLISASQS